MGNAKPFKVLHIVGAMNAGGTETMLMNIYRKIDRDQIQFDFVSYSSEEAHYDQEIRRFGGKIIKLSKTNSVKALYDVMKKYGTYDVVHSHTLFHSGISNVAAFLAGVKVRISHAHTTRDDSSTLFRKMYIHVMRLIILRFSTNLLACSEDAGRYLFGRGGIKKAIYAYFPNTIDYSGFLQAPETEVKKFKLEKGLGNSVVIGHIGRFIEAKNHLFLLNIFKKLVEKDSTVKLLLVGDGELRKLIEKRAKKEGIYKNITFAGIRNDINTMLHSMDVFVFPSIYEGLGLVLLEAQASDVPCVVSEAIQPEADVGVELVSTLSLDDSPDVWADKIVEVAANKERNINKITEAFEQSGYSITEGVSTLINIYQGNKGEAYERHVDRLI
ncbi:glycosyltransferase family 1 protein [Virgibacillus oceani]